MDTPTRTGRYVCPTCRRVSCHPGDVLHRFCPTCGFESDPLSVRQARAAEAAKRPGSTPIGFARP